jgi:hypothetical protein
VACCAALQLEECPFSTALGLLCAWACCALLRCARPQRCAWLCCVRKLAVWILVGGDPRALYLSLYVHTHSFSLSLSLHTHALSLSVIFTLASTPRYNRVMSQPPRGEAPSQSQSLSPLCEDINNIHEAPHHAAVLKNPPACGTSRLRRLESSRIALLFWGAWPAALLPNPRSVESYACGAVRWRSAIRLALADSRMVAAVYIDVRAEKAG